MGDKVKELMESLEEKIEDVQDSKEFKEMLEFFSKFHDYSYHNTLLIKMQKPDASYVAGYRQWQDKFNRHVKEGEEGIAILAPFTYTTTETRIKEVMTAEGDLEKKEVEEEVKRTYFRPVYVFDISQTEGEEVPELDMSLDDDFSLLLSPLEEFADEKGIELIYKELSEGFKGFSKENKIVLE
ncbi:ArdC family protein [Halarsenatibacter silvermanii]|uniref:N-terminal domain-containing protein n=1 Tax=Halarsenatibacter silvermanii TaxID=321763 RepID=A0A1G9RVD6_9FIRM|nr:ArdC family protein [Halarsenatibacter silvermanii]SDM27122.1 hypothetical protein SAMN04488692_12419 [Halarsenatibacter silvermanii]